MLAEQCSEYADMLYFMKRVFEMKNELLSSDESHLFSMACKNYIKNFRQSIRMIQAYKSVEKKKSKSDFLVYIMDYEKFVSEELCDKCQGIIKFIDDNIFKKSNYKEYSNELKLFYIKMKADYNKYIAETEHSKKKEFEKEAEKYYDEGEIFAKKMPISNSYKIGLLLNKSVFIYEVKKIIKKQLN